MMQFPPYIAELKGHAHHHLVFSSGKSPVGTPICVNWMQLNYWMQIAGHEKVREKLHAKLFSPWSPAEGEFGRKSDSFGYATMVVFDLDKIDTMDIDVVSSWCESNSVLVHTTFSHGVDGLGCYRIYMALDAPVNAKDYKVVHAAVLRTLPELSRRVDPTCADPARCYFMPSCPSERHYLAAMRPSLGGPVVEVGRFLQPVGIGQNAVQLVSQSPGGILSTVTTSAIAALMPPPAVQGQRNQTLTSLAGRAYAKGYTPEALQPEAELWGLKCTPPMDPKEVAATVQSMWQTHTRKNPPPAISTNVQHAQPSGKYLITAMELMALPPQDYCVRGVLPMRGLCSIYGASGSGKTFLALDIAFAIAFRTYWFGNPITNAPVVYVALEGEAGISQRVKAYEQHHGKQAPSNLRFVIRSVSLMEPGECDALGSEIVATVGRGTIIFIDTLNRAAPTADENTSADMGSVIEGAKRLADAVDGLVILIHHSGKDQSRGMRGHSSLFAAMDAVVEVTRTKLGRNWSIAKSKDSVDGDSHAFDLELVKLGFDKWGMDVTSCTVVQPIAARTVPRKPLKGEQQTKAYAAVLNLLGDALNCPMGVTTRTGAEAAVAKVLTCELKRRRERAKALVTALIQAGHFLESNGNISNA